MMLRLTRIVLETTLLEVQTTHSKQEPEQIVISALSVFVALFPITASVFHCFFSVNSSTVSVGSTTFGLQTVIYTEIHRHFTLLWPVDSIPIP